MENEHKQIFSDVAKYYSEKLAEFGESARGVDWNGEESQHLRFAQLSKVLPVDEDFSINDLGCGYGAYFDYLSNRGRNFQYLGVDISPEMIVAAETARGGRANARFECAAAPSVPAEFGVASGIFNVRLQIPDDEWLSFIEKTLEVLDKSSKRGFAFNCLTSYSDEDKKRSHLYYANPGYFFDLCKHKYSRNVALLHDYDLYEFTIIVRKK
jgi:SAM-dependent methyltransferase